MKDTQTVLFRRGSFIAVRHDKGWWLSQLYTHVFDGSEKARIRWFDEVPEKGSDKLFVIDECNDIPMKSIICSVKVKRLSRQPMKVSVAAIDCKLVANLLSQSKNPKSSSKDSPTNSPKKATKKKGKGSLGSKSKRKAAIKKSAAKRKAATKAGPAAKKKKKVTCYSNITLYQRNPVWDPKTDIPHVAPTVNSMLYTRAVKNKQYGEVEKLQKDLKLFAHLFGYVQGQGCCNKLVSKNSWHFAIDNKDKKMISLLKKLSDKENIISNSSHRVGKTNSLLEVVNTGTYNPASLGIEHVRPLTMARGSREGINAFQPLYTDDSNVLNMKTVVKYAISQGHDYQFIKFLMLTLNPECPNTDMINYLTTALWSNNRQVAATIAKESLACGDTDSFNQLHYEVLAFNKSEKLTTFKSVNCHKKTNYYYGRLTPLHSAALNPNADYLKQMLRENPQPEIKDGAGYTPLHYAAISTSAAATKFLLSQNVNPLVTSTAGITPLMWAAKAGSAVNIKALLGNAYAGHFAARTPGPIDTSRIVDIDLIKSVTKEAGRVNSKSVVTEPGEADESITARHLLKTGIGGMEMAVLKGKVSTYTALTFAVECGHYEAVSVLLDLGANPNKSLGAARRKMFPLHIAAKYGHLEILKCLILHGAKTRSKDRHGLTAFHYAAKYNQLHCVSWLAANVVPDANIGDSSGNTPLQYACAEGYILVVKYLVEQLKVDVKQTNSWGMPALEVAFLRQQLGVVEYLLNAADIDINFRDNAGATLVMKLCVESMEDKCKTMEPLEFLLNKPGIDALAVDTNGCNALHYLAVQESGTAENYDGILELLINLGLDINSKTTNGKTALLIAVANKARGHHFKVNTVLIQSLIKHGADIRDIRLEHNRNIMQYFAAGCSELSLGIIEIIEQGSSAELLKELVEHRDDLGMNILHIVVEKCFCSGKKSTGDPWKMFEKLLGSSFNMDINSEVKERKLDEKAKCDCNTKDEVHTIEEDTAYVCTKSCSVFPYTKQGLFRPLNFAMKYGSGIDDVKKILAYKPDLNYKDNDGLYPLHHAVLGGKVDLIPILLEHHPLTDVLADPGICKDNIYADYPILVLAAMFCVDSVMTLVEAGACTYSSAPDGRNVLHHIVSRYDNLHQRITIAEKLLPLVDDVNDVDKDGNSYLHHAVSGVEHGSNVSIEMISTLLLMGADPNLLNTKGQTPLHFAFLSSGQKHASTELSDPIEVVSILTQLMKKESISAADSYHGFTALHLSAMRGGSVTSIHLISHGCEIEAVDNQGNTPLTLAVSGKHQSCVLMLIEKGANIDRSVCYPIFRTDPEKTKKEKTKKKTEEETKYTWLPSKEKGLISPPTNPTSSSSNIILYQVIRHEWQGVLFKLVDLLKQSFVPLEAAIVLMKFNLAVTLLLKFGKSVTPGDCNDKGQTLVHSLAFTTNTEPELQKRLLNLLIKFQYSVTSTDTAYKCTPLHYACYQKKFEICKLLVKPITVNCKDMFGRTPLCALFWRGPPDEEIVRHLVQQGASLENTCDFNLHESCYPLFDYKFQIGQSDYFTSYSQRYTVLIKAILEDNMTCFQYLLDLGADTSTPCSRGMTPLMYAAKLNRVTMFQKMLKSAKSDVFSSKSEDSRTILHYAVLSHLEAELESPDILKRSITHLKKSGTLGEILEIRDCERKTVLDYCQKLPAYLRMLGNVSVHSNNHASPHDETTKQPPDFTADCEKYFAQIEESRKGNGEQKALPDDCVSLNSDECEVYRDDKGVFYDMLMTKIDIKIRSHGIYNFYKLQLLRNKGKDIYVLLNKWGRIGDSGQHQETPFPTLEECKAEFMKIFKAKTKNDWNDLDNFVAHPGKYRLVNREWRYHNQFKDIEYDFREDEHPCLSMDKKVFEVLLEATEPKNMKNMLEDDLKLNVAELPFGFIKLDVLDNVDRILDGIEKLVKETENLKTKADLTDSKSQSEFMIKTQKIYDLTNEIYQLVPQKGFNVTLVNPLNTLPEIKEWRTKLTNLRDMEVINRIMAGSQLHKMRTHPLTYVYNSIGCDITPLDPQGVTTQYLTRSIFASGGSSCKGIRGIYKLNPHVPDQRKAGKRRLLFHGISTGALLSILKRGLQNAPFGRAYGTQFGEGIYLADNFEKSLSYAQGHKSQFVLVASVVMGKVHRHIPCNVWQNPDSDEMPDVDTTWAVGKLHQDPAYNIVLPCGNMIGMSKFQEAKKESFSRIKTKNQGWGGGADFTMTLRFSDKPTVHSSSDDDDDDNDEESGEDCSDEEDSEEEEEDETDKKDEGKEEFMDTYRYRNLPKHSEYIVKNADNIRLEYLVQIRY